MLFFPFSRVRVEDDLLLVLSFTGRRWGMEGGGGEERRREGAGKRGREGGRRRPACSPLEAGDGDGSLVREFWEGDGSLASRESGRGRESRGVRE